MTRSASGKPAQPSPKRQVSAIGQRRASARDRSGEAYRRRRAEIFAAAASVFREKGYQASTLADVAEVVGVDRASLYFYVSSKQQIFDEIVSDVVTSNTLAAEEIAAAELPAPDKVRLLIRQLMESFGESYPFLYVFIQENLAHVSAERKGWAADLRATNRRYENSIRSVFAQGVEEGTLKPVAATNVSLYGLMGMLGWTHRWFNPETSPLSTQAIADVYADILIKGLVTRPQAPSSPQRTPTPTIEPDEVTALRKRLAAQGHVAYDELSVLRARAQLDTVVGLQRPPQAIAHVDDVLLEGADGRLPARIYRPRSQRPLPVVVYLHGGGWTLGGSEVTDSPCRALANEAQCVVIAVEYRLAPETKFPGPLEDCVSAVRWAAAHASSYGGSEHVVLLGDGAGGNLAAATTSMLRDQGQSPVVAQVLLYPLLAPPRSTSFASSSTFASGPLITRAELDWFWDHYLTSPEEAMSPLAAPLHATDLTGLPPTTLVVAGLDPAHDEGVSYARRLEAAGVPVRLLEVDDAPHGFWWLDGVLSQGASLTSTLATVIKGAPALRDPAPDEKA